MRRAIPGRERRAIIQDLELLPRKPKLAVVMPVYNPAPAHLAAAINSVRHQLYSNWELCIANDASTDPRIAKILDQAVQKDSRIKVFHRTENGHISSATNSALELVNSDFFGLLDHDDLLAPDALYEVAKVLNKTDDVDVIYSDEDRVGAFGGFSGAYRKPDFNAELLLGQNVVSHLGVNRTSLIRKLGGLRKGFEGSQDYDLALRALSASHASRIKHIPKVLYHWRKGGLRGSFSQDNLDRCVAAARNAIQDYLHRENEGAVVVPNPSSKYFSRVIRKVPVPEPLVSCIIPTRNKAKLLKVCLEGLLNKTTYRNLDVIIVDNNSDDPETLALFEHYIRIDPRVRVLQFEGPFNYSAINNFAVGSAKGQLLAFLNNDIEMTDGGWLYELVSHAVRPMAGAVGAKLYYPNGRIQHAGVVIGLKGLAGHAMRGKPKSDLGYFGQGVLTRQVSALTAACMIVPRAAFDAVGGFDDVHLPIAFNDTDFCNIWTPFAELVHHESASRGRDLTPQKLARSKAEIAYFKKRWANVIASDPFYTTNFG